MILFLPEMQIWRMSISRGERESRKVPIQKEGRWPWQSERDEEISEARSRAQTGDAYSFSFAALSESAGDKFRSSLTNSAHQAAREVKTQICLATGDVEGKKSLRRTKKDGLGADALGALPIPHVE